LLIDVTGSIGFSLFCLSPFKGGDKEIEAIIKQESDVVIVYGGKELQ
jgi:hypothetical protein